MKFKDREEAGLLLAEFVQESLDKEHAIDLILALPRGGVGIGYECSKTLKIPLDVIIPRKIGHPQNPEFAIGAITKNYEFLFDQEKKKDCITE